MYQRSSCLLVVILFTTTLTFCQADNQEIRCPCSHCADNQANCAMRRYQHVPGPFPKDIIGINMQFNRIETITKDSFGELPELELLRLDDNRINDVRPGAFSQMPKLNELVLNKNAIMVLPADLVHPDAPLANGIKLNNNGLTSFPLALLLRTRKTINVRDNPINCNCFSVIPQDLKSKVIGVCDSPRHLKGKDISDITYEDVNCTVCRNVKCNGGSCYSYDGMNHKCICDNVSDGDDCSEIFVDVSTTPKPTKTSTTCLLYTSPSPRDGLLSRMPSSA